MIAWLITWEGSGRHVTMDNAIAAILNSRLSPKMVMNIVELIYANKCYSLHERLASVKNKKNNPYPAEFDRIEGIQYPERIFCGHNPHLYARKVNNIKIKHDKNGRESLTWDERKRPEPPSWLKG